MPVSSDPCLPCGFGVDSATGAPALFGPVEQPWPYTSNIDVYNGIRCDPNTKKLWVAPNGPVAFVNAAQVVAATYPITGLTTGPINVAPSFVLSWTNNTGRPYFFMHYIELHGGTISFRDTLIHLMIMYNWQIGTIPPPSSVFAHSAMTSRTPLTNTFSQWVGLHSQIRFFGPVNPGETLYLRTNPAYNVLDYSSVFGPQQVVIYFLDASLIGWPVS